LKEFIDLSHMMDEHHNTTIFAPGHPCEMVFISNSAFARVLTELCHISFRKMTADILGATYESYLGYRFSLKNGRIEAEVDQRVRKQAGIYYTPSYIVRYIVGNTLGVKLKELEDQYGLEAGEKAKDLKILDPACGSGSFLIYAFDVLANFYEKLNAKITEKQVELSKINSNSDMFERQEQFKRLPSRVADYPQKILEDHLYGVDLDPAACEIATINLVIKAFEKMRDKKLPLILNQNVKVGNSLISGVEKREDLEKFKSKITQHIELRRRLKQAEDDEEKRELMKEIDQLRQKVNSQLNESLKKYFDHPEEKRSFNWEFEFPEVFDSEKPEDQKGFDVVIGNPPYLLMQISNTPKEVLDYVESNFKVAQYKIDSYHLFLEKAISLLNLNGFHSFIVPNTFLINKHTNRLREYILSLCAIKNISMIPETVFESAEVDNSIVVFKRQENAQARSENEVSIFDFGAKQDHKISILPIGQIKQKIFEEQHGYVFNINLASGVVEIANKIQHNSIPLGSLLRVYFGIQTYDRKKYVSGTRIDQTYKRALDGEDIQRYCLTPKERYVKFVPSAIKSGGEPRVHFAKEKIIVLQIGSEPKGTLDVNKYCTLNTIYNLTAKELGDYRIKYLLAIINSKAITSFWRVMFYDRKQLFPKIKKKPLQNIPVHVIDFSNHSEKARHAQLVKYVDIMLERNKQKNELLKIFEQVLNNHTHEFQSFSKAYYEKPEYIEKIDKKATEVANLTDEVSKIFLEDERKTLVFSVLLKGERQVALRLKIADEDFRLFLFYSVRKYLEENKRRKKWTTKSLPKVLDVILGRLEVPVFKSSGKIHDPRYNLRMINLIMKEFKTKFHKQFPKGNLHLSQIEKEIQDTDNSIDALVFKLYELNKEEV
ncbi:MAG: N-6 DNA methylase, partial [candidate division Zixibacteria bacterium]|nr:N-6 DNA methylase [candidate division Zixibacteria bacterium]